MFQRNRKCTAGNKLTFWIKFAFVKLIYTYAMRDNLSKPSCLVITKVLLWETKQSFGCIYDTYKFSLQGDAIANTTDDNQLTHFKNGWACAINAKPETLLPVVVRESKTSAA